MLELRKLTFFTLLVWACSSIIVQDSSCANYYNQSNLPAECSNLNCNFGPITNSSLIVNPPFPNQTYVVCLDLPQQNVTIGTGIDNLQSSLYILANSITLGPSYAFKSSQALILIASQTITVYMSNFTASLIWMQSDSLNLLETQVHNQQFFPTECNCIQKGVSCTVNNYYFPYLYNNPNYPSNFTMELLNATYQTWNFVGSGVNSVVLTSNTSISIQSSTLRISVIAIYTESLNIQNSVMNVSGLGFPSGTGYGCGYFDEILNKLLACSGSGGSYGGYGGNSAPDSCNLLIPNPPYGKDSIPKYPGSGGGNFLKQIAEISSGGGVVMIQVYQMSIQSSQILSNGFAGIQGAGGGSGGSISIDYYQAQFNGNIIVQCNGGNGQSSGGGGRMRVWNHNWNNPIPNSNAAASLTFRVVGGTACDKTEGNLACGMKGSIITPPCPPGYQLNQSSLTCQTCPVGTYQLLYSYSSCLQCQNKPANSVYVAVDSGTISSDFLQVCSFVCKSSSFTSYKGRQCLSKLEYVLADVGGINLLICLAMVLGTLLVLLVAVMVRKLSQSGQAQFLQNDYIDSAHKRAYFKIEDIPYHEIRLYFQGNNENSSPWRISSSVGQQLCSKYEYDAKLTQIIPRLLRQINEISQYSRWMKIVLFCVKFTYYPFGLLLASVFRDNKVKRIRNAILLKFKNFESNLTIKLHVNEQATVGCLQLFNSKKQTLDFYIKNYFPLFFKLQKLPLGGYAIDLLDPLIRALCSEFEQHNQRKLQNFLLELNHLLRNSEQTLPIYKHLWKISEHQPSMQCYLWQPHRGILGIDNNIQIVKKLDLFLLFSTDNKSDNSHSASSNSPNHMIEQFRHSERFDRHFLYKQQLNNVYLDQITCIRHKYTLRQLITENQERRTVFWQIDNSINMKYLWWALGTVNILTFLFSFVTVPIVIFLLVVDEEHPIVLGFIPYFALFPLCQFFHVYAQFSLLLAKGARIITYAIYFALFSMIKYICLIVVMLIIMLTNDYSSLLGQVLFYIFLCILILNAIAIVLLCMLHVHISKPK